MISSATEDNEVDEGPDAISIHDSAKLVLAGGWIHGCGKEWRRAINVPSGRCLEDDATGREDTMVWSGRGVSSAPPNWRPGRGGRWSCIVSGSQVVTERRRGRLYKLGPYGDGWGDALKWAARVVPARGPCLGLAMFKRRRRTKADKAAAAGWSARQRSADGGSRVWLWRRFAVVAAGAARDKATFANGLTLPPSTATSPACARSGPLGDLAVCGIGMALCGV